MDSISTYLRTGDGNLIRLMNFTELMHILLNSFLLYEDFKKDEKLWTYLFKNKFGYSPPLSTDVFYQYQEEFNKRIFVTGSNIHNKLFPSKNFKIYIPQEIMGIPYISKVATGLHHTILVDNYNRIYGIGANNRRQLGFVSLDDVVFPQEIKLPKSIEVVSVVCGFHFTYILGRDNNTGQQVIYNMGNNTHGQLGYKTQNSFESLNELNLKYKVNEILCGENHTLFITSEDVYGCGSNVYGQLGFVYIKDTSRSMIIEPEKIVSYDRIVKCQTGANHVIYESYYGEIMGMGDNRYGQLGLGDITDTRESGSMNLFMDSTFDNSGYHQRNLQGIDDKKIYSSEIYCGANFTILKNRQMLLVMGSNSNNQLIKTDSSTYIRFPMIIELEISIKNIYCGYSHVIYENYDGDFYGAGKNIYGELGIGEQITDTYLNPLALKADKLLDIKLGDVCTIFLTNGYIMVHYNEYILKLAKDEIEFDKVELEERSGVRVIFFNDKMTPGRNFMTYIMEENL